MKERPREISLEESPMEAMMSMEFGVEVTDQQMKEQWEARQAEANRIEALRVKLREADRERLKALGKVA
tara:strand:- start:309 stop:515 length:207 start_codon:yes stop_codon:yes gene_type:complete